MNRVTRQIIVPPQRTSILARKVPLKASWAWMSGDSSPATNNTQRA